jgi:uncharacterized protein (TIGR02996 family)
MTPTHTSTTLPVTFGFAGGPAGMTAPDPEYLALLRGVLETPGCDTARLVLADWLDENGQGERAGFIRAQIADPGGEKRLAFAYYTGGTDAAGVWTWDAGHAPRWAGGERVPGADARALTFRRGFVGRLEMSARDFLTHAKELFGGHPITGVRLTDRRPDRTHNPAAPWRWWFGREAESELPESLYQLVHGREGPLPRFATEADAIASLSRACVTYGRRLAGLAPLPEPVAA